MKETTWTRAYLKQWKGNSHKSVDFWQGLILHSRMGLPLDDGADRLNDLLWLAKQASDGSQVQTKKYGSRRDNE